MACYSNLRENKIENPLTFKCSNDEVISTAYVCDNISDCSNSTDEVSCTCSNVINMYCKTICTTNGCKYSQLYFRSRRGICISYVA